MSLAAARRGAIEDAKARRAIAGFRGAKYSGFSPLVIQQMDKLGAAETKLARIPAGGIPDLIEHRKVLLRLIKARKDLESGKAVNSMTFERLMASCNELADMILQHLSVRDWQALNEAFEKPPAPMREEINRRGKAAYQKHIGHLVALFDTSTDISVEEHAKEYIRKHLDEFNFRLLGKAVRHWGIFTACAICNVANARARFNHFCEYLEEHAARIKLHDDFNSPRAIEKEFYDHIDEEKLDLQGILEVLKRSIPYDVTPVEFFRFCKALVKAACSDQWSKGDEASRDRLHVNVVPIVYDQLAKQHGVTEPQEYCVEFHYYNLQNGRGTACMRFRLMMPTTPETRGGFCRPGVCISYGTEPPPGNFAYDFAARYRDVFSNPLTEKEQEEWQKLYGRGGRTDTFIGTVEWDHALFCHKYPTGWGEVPTPKKDPRNFEVFKDIRAAVKELESSPGIPYLAGTIKDICKRWRMMDNTRQRKSTALRLMARVPFEAVYRLIVKPWFFPKSDMLENFTASKETHKEIYNLVLYYCAREADIQMLANQLCVEINAKRTDSFFDSLLDISIIPPSMVHQTKMFTEDIADTFKHSYGMQDPEKLPAGHFQDSFAKMCVDFGYPFYPASKAVDRLNPPAATNYKVAAPFIDRTLHCSGITNA